MTGRRIVSSPAESGTGRAPGPRGARRILVIVLVCALLATVSGCGFAGAGATGGHGTTITVAIVSNPQMEDVQKLIDVFHRQHPDINVRFVSLPENESRQKTTESVSTASGEFDVTMVSNYETPIWARNGWLRDLKPYISRTPGYDESDFVPTVRKALSYKGDMYSVPFYGESSFLMYRKDLFRKKGLTMPAHPTWPQVRALAAKLDDPAHGLSGICLRGLSGWGELMAPLDTVINTFGGRWYDRNWHAKLESPAVRRAVRFYVNLVRDYGEPGAATSGYTQCLDNFSNGNSAMWYDSTAAVSTVEDPSASKVAGKVDYVPAPVQSNPGTGWLYSWSLAIPKTTQHADAAWKFVSWATSKRYIKLVGRRLGWSRLPPASRLSTYRIPQYRKLAKNFVKPTLNAIDAPTVTHPTAKPVPYSGGQFLDIPEFIDLGTRVSQQISAAIAGQQSVGAALAQSQRFAQTVGDSYGSH